MDDKTQNWCLVLSDNHCDRSVFPYPTPPGVIPAEQIRQATINVWNKQKRENVRSILLVPECKYLAIQNIAENCRVKLLIALEALSQNETCTLEYAAANPDSRAAKNTMVIDQLNQFIKENEK